MGSMINEEIDKLNSFFRKQSKKEFSIAIEEFREITGVQLPNKAKFSWYWWRNISTVKHSNAWISAGYETFNIKNIETSKKIYFRKITSLTTVKKIRYNKYYTYLSQIIIGLIITTLSYIIFQNPINTYIKQVDLKNKMNNIEKLSIIEQYSDVIYESNKILSDVEKAIPRELCKLYLMMYNAFDKTEKKIELNNVLDLAINYSHNNNYFDYEILFLILRAEKLIDVDVIEENINNTNTNTKNIISYDLIAADTLLYKALDLSIEHKIVNKLYYIYYYLGNICYYRVELGIYEDNIVNANTIREYFNMSFYVFQEVVLNSTEYQDAMIEANKFFENDLFSPSKDYYSIKLSYLFEKTISDPNIDIEYRINDCTYLNKFVTHYSTHITADMFKYNEFDSLYFAFQMRRILISIMKTYDGIDFAKSLYIEYFVYCLEYMTRKKSNTAIIEEMYQHLDFIISLEKNEELYDYIIGLKELVISNFSNQ